MKQQKHKLIKRVLSVVLSLSMALCLIPSTVFAAEGDPVAKIENTTYATLDEAVAAAADGATIELLADATTNGLNLSKNLTIKAAEGLAEKPTITFTQYGIALWGKALTFENCNVVMNGIGSTPYTGEWNWMTICASINASLTLNNVNMTMDATGTTNSPHAIYFCNNNVLNIENNSNLTIKNYANDALEWDGGNGGYNVNITNSTFLSDQNRSGFTGTFYATITNSDVDVVNSTGNGSNGSHFIIKNSNVNFSDNGSHGLSAGELSIDNSIVTTNNNKGMGIAVNNGFTVTNHSTVTVTGNASNSSYGYAAVRLYNNFNFSVDGSSSLLIRDNNNTGLYVRQGNLKVDKGANLVITGNKVTHNALGGYGGGIYVGYGDNYDPTVVLPADAKIYNNHAITGGDDIYVSEGVNGPSLTFGEVGTNWALDGDPDCEHLIDGWYDDAPNDRWEAHAETPEDNHIQKFTTFENGLATVGSLTYLKAAHGADAQDKTSYPGLDKTILLPNGDMVDTDTIAAGDSVTFRLESNVPEDLPNYLAPEKPSDPSIQLLAVDPNSGTYPLTFHDQMDDAFVNPSNFVVTLDREGDNDVVLTADQYTLTQTGLTDGCDFELTIDLAKLYGSVITDDDIANATPIVVTYTATLAAGTTAGDYYNSAWVSYPNDETEIDTVTVETFKLNIFKYDQENSSVGLAGAEFELKDSEGNVVATIISGSDGYAIVDGLDAGKYTLTETKAPEGYVCSNVPLTVTIEAGIDPNVVAVYFANTQIPHTGGMGTTLYTVGGGLIVAAAAVLFVVSRKKRQSK